VVSASVGSTPVPRFSAQRAKAPSCLRVMVCLDGMEAEQHHGFDPGEVVPLMAGAGLRLVRHERFELGLNHLFVFDRPTISEPRDRP